MLVTTVFIIQILVVRGEFQWGWDVPFEGEFFTQPPAEGSGESEDDTTDSEGEVVTETPSKNSEQLAVPRLTGLIKTVADPIPSAMEVLKALYGQGSPMDKSLATLFIDESVKNILLSRTLAENQGEGVWLPRTQDAYDREISAIDTSRESVGFRAYLDTLKRAPRSLEGFPQSSLNWEIGDSERRPFGSVVDSCELDLGSCVNGETINKLLIRFIASMDSGQENYLNVFEGDQFFWSQDYLKFLLKSYHSTGVSSLGQDRQRFLFGKLTLQSLIDSRQTRLAVKRLQESLGEQLISTIKLGNQITGALNKLRIEVAKSKFPAQTRRYPIQQLQPQGILYPRDDEISNTLGLIMKEFENSTISLQEALSLVKDIHSSVQAIYQIYEKYYLKYGVLVALILISILVVNEAFKLLVSMCLCISREYTVVRDFLTYRTQRRTNIEGRSTVREDDSRPLALSTFRYRRGVLEE